MNKRIALLVVAAFAFAIALGVVSTNRVEASATQYWYPLNYTYYDWCFGENIAVDGRVHYTWNYTSDGDGGFHYVVRMNYAGVSGTGLTSGLRYAASGTYSNSFNVRPPFPYETSAQSRFRWSQQGGGSQSYRANWHYTVNANGDLTATVSNFASNCNP